MNDGSEGVGRPVKLASVMRYRPDSGVVSGDRNRAPGRGNVNDGYSNDFAVRRRGIRSVLIPGQGRVVAGRWVGEEAREAGSEGQLRHGRFQLALNARLTHGVARARDGVRRLAVEFPSPLPPPARPWFGCCLAVSALLPCLHPWHEISVRYCLRTTCHRLIRLFPSLTRSKGAPISPAQPVLGRCGTFPLPSATISDYLLDKSTKASGVVGLVCGSSPPGNVVSSR
ncbi:uncharacterized protein BO80DRAFT_134310 [Aspergillus ibericus CBS 121593]|uniref:Uncharacterized protein n=1 Tax=Aspergillus ibericus CBS 121593 TaxID=1448316 RepID=A0A395HC85_9EURO|nr:hypothetical protein BO80DRAFT_134310 [Aspergillus ibericus CBS 121593]RAL05320.1 hypothetical protein BO80DRAFT_134310 [Aspergillus ibericus CBS 121593]